MFVNLVLDGISSQWEMIGNARGGKKANFMTKPTQQLLLDIAQGKKVVHFFSLFLKNNVRFLLIP